MDDQEDQLREAVEIRYSCKATLFYVAHVHELLSSPSGTSLWDHHVYVFDLQGHGSAIRAYAWFFPDGGGDSKRSTAFLIAPTCAARPMQ